jgi:hypothetical protein
MLARLTCLAATSLAALLLVAGCGGDDESGGDASVAGSTASAGVSKSEFIDQANSLCAKRSAELKVKGRRVFKEVFTKPEPIAAKAMTTKVIIPVFEGELRDLKTLNVPPNDGEKVSAIYKAIEDMIARIKKNPQAEGFYPYKEAEKLSAEYGITACGHP